ncbi:MAG TPA: FAD:protein FMN transferase [archaeon]|nr:FAD:protein FMN transferase [archaeon]
MAQDNYEFYEGLERTMGTVIRLYAYHPPGKREWMRALADRFFDSLLEDNRRLSIYVKGSLINRINRAAGGEAVPVDRDTFALLAASRGYWEITGGLFDITSGALMRAFGYYEDTVLPERPAHSADPDTLKKLTGCDKLELDEPNSAVRLDRPGMLLDLGGIAKGWCVEKRARILLSAGLEDFVISAGTSTVLARGSPPGEEGWPMELESPDGRKENEEQTVLTDCAISVSGNYRHTLTGAGGLTVRHIMNPLTLEPVSQVRQVVVSGPDAAECEALSTAFLIQGELEGAINSEDRPDITVIIKNLT